MQYIRFVVFSVLVGLVADSQAAVILSIGTVTTPIDAGMPVTIPFYAYNESGSASLQGYSVTVDIGGDDDNIPSYVTTASFNSSLGSGAFDDSSAAGGGEDFDYIVSLVGASETISGDALNPTELFTLTLGTSPSTAGGTYETEYGTEFFARNFTFFTVGGNPVPLQAVDSDVQFDSNPGQFSVNASAVPEPGSVLVLAGLCMAGGVRQWRKKKRASAASVAA